MSSHDISPLFRTAIGFDRIAGLLDSSSGAANPPYPPYNIEKTGTDTYRLSMAVAGFSASDLDVSVADGRLTVTGELAKTGQDANYLHRGISGRSFQRRFVLADHLVVEGSTLENGLLHVELHRVLPEALKPRRIAITAAPQAQPTIEGVAQPQASNLQVEQGAA